MAGDARRSGQAGPQKFGAVGLEVEGIIRSFATLADNLVREFELDDLLGQVITEALRLLPAESAAIVVDRDQTLVVAAASDAGARRVAEVELADGSGPCVDASRDQNAHVLDDVDAIARTWPSYAAAVAAAGYEAVWAMPMRERDESIGALGLFGRQGPRLTDCDLQLAQALADIAALAVVQHGRAHSAELAGQLQQALNSRIVVEQAKGVIAEHAGIDMGAAFGALRSYARSRQLKVSQVARAVTEHEIEPGQIVADGVPE